MMAWYDGGAGEDGRRRGVTNESDVDFRLRALQELCSDGQSAGRVKDDWWV